jgi:hypothetical protein
MLNSEITLWSKIQTNNTSVTSPLLQGARTFRCCRLVTNLQWLACNEQLCRDLIILKSNLNGGCREQTYFVIFIPLLVKKYYALWG